MIPPRNDGTLKRGVLSDDLAVLLVDKLVHLGTYLLNEDLRLLAVDVDDYPAGAALCHRLMFWHRWTNARHGMGQHKKTTILSP
jgi:hypothetical protein